MRAKAKKDKDTIDLMFDQIDFRRIITSNNHIL